MLKIAKSLITIAAVAAIAVGATGAYFTDEVKISGNSFKTGTIDIDVDGVNDSSHTSFTYTDMKPGYVVNSDFVVNNVGTNPANIYKTLNVTTNEANLAAVIDYNLSVAITNGWNQTLYNYDITLSGVNGSKVFLGMLPNGMNMNVTESYRMQTSAGDSYQNKTLGFDITVTAEQLQGTLVLENKNPANWQILGTDLTKGTLTYGVMDKKFNYSFSGSGLAASTGYTLVMGNDYPFAGGALASATTDGSGNIAISGTKDFVANQINQKVWLVLSSDYSGSVTGWAPGSYLFETGLIDYYDSGV